MSEKRFHIERDSAKAFTFFYDGRRRMYDEEVVNLLNEQTVEIQKLTKERNHYKGKIKQKNDKIERLQRENNKLQVHYKYDVKHLKEENDGIKTKGLEVLAFYESKLKNVLGTDDFQSVRDEIWIVRQVLYEMGVINDE